MVDVAPILPLFGLRPEEFAVERIGSGHIHFTYKLSGVRNYILQRVNKNVFQQPERIAANLRYAASYLSSYVPDYLFLSCIRSTRGHELEYDAEGYPWRLFPFIDDTVTFDKVDSPGQAYEAAREFARLTRYLDGADPTVFQYTIDRFHDLALRKEQFDDALLRAKPEIKKSAASCIEQCERSSALVDQYKDLTSGGSLRLRIVHNDTKINNVLFNRTTLKTVAVIDLDTLMPGYFIYDLGDMVRTFVCPVSEEESNLSKVTFRREIYAALLEGYLSEMDPVLTAGERKAIPFAGKMMTYIMAIRFLADYLRGNTYYHITYPEQNLVRSANQLRLLEVISANLPD